MWCQVSSEVKDLCQEQAEKFVQPVLSSLGSWLEAQSAKNPLCSVRTNGLNKLWDLADGSVSLTFHQSAQDVDVLAKQADSKRNGYWAFEVVYTGDFRGLLASLPQRRLQERRNVAIAILESGCGVRITSNPEFSVVEKACPSIEKFQNPFKDCAADELLVFLNTSGLLR